MSGSPTGPPGLMLASPICVCDYESVYVCLCVSVTENTGNEEHIKLQSSTQRRFLSSWIYVKAFQWTKRIKPKVNSRLCCCRTEAFPVSFQLVEPPLGTLVSTFGPSLYPTSVLNFFRKVGSAGFTHETPPLLFLSILNETLPKLLPTETSSWSSPSWRWGQL